jgi:hypothetical protein
MSKLDKLPHSRQDIIEWVYKHQIETKVSGMKIHKLSIKCLQPFLLFPLKKESMRGVCGFRGSTSLVTDRNVSFKPNSFTSIEKG